MFMRQTAPLYMRQTARMMRPVPVCNLHRFDALEANDYTERRAWRYVEDQLIETKE
jgi:hypothetical protein